METHHEDLVHDVCFDFYGKRMASCSSDQKIKIWDKVNDKWKPVADWKAHAGSIWKLTWAHPEFSQIIASCSFDRTVCIWEEEEVGKPWIKRATLVDSRDSVRDCKFAPRHLGLKLATCSADGFVRIYEALDVTNLDYWSLMEEFESHKGQLSCISWNSSPLEARPQIVVGAQSDPNLKIWDYNESYRRWVHIATLSGHSQGIHDVSWAPNFGRTYHLIATGSRDKHIKIWKLSQSYSSSSNASSSSTTTIAPSQGKLELQAPQPLLTPSLSAPNNNSAPSSSAPQSISGYNVEVIYTHKELNGEVWRVEWNITGTLLAASTGTGPSDTVILKASPTGDWEEIQKDHLSSDPIVLTSISRSMDLTL